MPPRPSIPRSIHLPSVTGAQASSSLASSSSGIPRPPRTTSNATSTLTHPKPHLAAYHLSAPPNFESHVQRATPLAPQLPTRRQPAFSPGGFGLQSAPKPQRLPTPLDLSASEHAEESLANLEREIAVGQGTNVKEKEEAEACYVVSCCSGPAADHMSGNLAGTSEDKQSERVRVRD